MSLLRLFMHYELLATFLAIVAFVSAVIRHCPSGSSFPPIFLLFSFLFFFFFLELNCTRDFRIHWIKGKSKLNCPRGCSEQKFTTVRVLNVAQTQEVFAQPFPTPAPSFPYNIPWSFVSLHLATNIRSVKWLCGWFYITLTDSRRKRDGKRRKDYGTEQRGQRWQKGQD